jgi:hypothetical protein
MEWVDLSEKHNLPNCIGAGVPAQWEPVVSDAILKIQELIDQGRDIHIRQIKEKFGSLRIYVAGTDWHLCESIIAEAETKCNGICVECGSTDDVKRATKKDSGWLQTLCKEHRDSE